MQALPAPGAMLIATYIAIMHILFGTYVACYNIILCDPQFQHINNVIN